MAPKGKPDLKKSGSKVLAGAKLAAAAKTAHGHLMAVIGDEETVTGMLLAGIGNVDARRTSNFFVVDAKTTPAAIEDAFNRFTKRSDVAIVLINQYIATQIRDTINAFESKSPAILEIPSKEHPYDPEQDAIHRRTKLLLGIRD
jgi:V-type H+-transporting ATPase subunit F